MKQPAYSLFVRDFDCDERTKAMTDSEVGLYLRCLNHSWLNQGLPNDPEKIRKMLPGSKRTPAPFRRDWRAVAECFKTPAEICKNCDEKLAELLKSYDPDRLFNPRQERQRALQENFSERQSGRAKSRRSNKNDRLEGDAVAPDESGAGPVVSWPRHVPRG